MLATADSARQGLFDASWCGNVVPRDSFYGLLAEHGERIVRDDDFADCYAAGHGRPSIPPSTLAKILLLAYRCSPPCSEKPGSSVFALRALDCALLDAQASELRRSACRLVREPRHRNTAAAQGALSPLHSAVPPEAFVGRGSVRRWTMALPRFPVVSRTPIARRQ